MAEFAFGVVSRAVSRRRHEAPRLVLQHGRDAARELVPSSAAPRRARAVVLGTTSSRSAIFTGLAMTAYPPPLARDDQVWRRIMAFSRCRASFVLEPGKTSSATASLWLAARLILLYLQSEAIPPARARSASVRDARLYGELGVRQGEPITQRSASKRAPFRMHHDRRLAREGGVSGSTVPRASVP